MTHSFLFTSESVSKGHPDKIADQISDLTLDYFLEQDPEARVAAETFVTPDLIVLAGEIRSSFTLNEKDLEARIRNLIKEIGYVKGLFTHDTIKIKINLRTQSADIAVGVDETSNKPEGAGDQGIMFGYACNDTTDFMPLPIYYSHQILRSIYDNVLNKKISGFGPDAKAQVTCKYVAGKPVAIDTILLSIQHEKNLSQNDIVAQLKPIILDVLPHHMINDSTKFLFNPTGRFVIGGPESDVGLTGRKIIVDTYGGSAPHGGGAFSGKDPTKVDRSAAYMARYLAKNIVAAGLTEKCLIQLSYAIGVAKPVSFFLDSFGTAVIDERKIMNYIENNIDLTPKGIRTRLDLNRPIYQISATYGHFGRKFIADKGYFSWENTNLTAELRSLIQK